MHINSPLLERSFGLSLSCPPHETSNQSVMQKVAMDVYPCLRSPNEDVHTIYVMDSVKPGFVQVDNQPAGMYADLCQGTVF
jgi:hypothetical protein